MQRGRTSGRNAPNSLATTLGRVVAACSLIALTAPGAAQDAPPAPALSEQPVAAAAAESPVEATVAEAAQPTDAEGVEASEPDEAPPGASAPEPAGPEPQSEPQAEPGSSPQNEGIRFNFKDAPIRQVIEFFSRVTSLPVVWDADVPEGTITYISAERYALPDALRVLNIILQSRGVMLRVSDDMLHLQKLDQMNREDIPTFIGAIPSDVTPDQIVSVVKPLNIALAKPMAEKLAQMVASYGSVTALEQQNALIITETAAQVQRLLTIVSQLDQEDPEGVIEIIPLRHTRAAQIMESLKALLSTRVEKYVINQQGQQVKIEEDQMPGLNISIDPRTNSVIAKGGQNRIDKLREAVTLLDVPAQDASRAAQSFALRVLKPEDAAGQLLALFASRPESERPAILAVPALSRVTIIGDAEAIEDARRAIIELDGAGSADDPLAQPIIATVPLRHADPQRIISLLNAVLPKDEQRSALQPLKLAPGPDNRSLIISGAAADIALVRSTVPSLDQPAADDYRFLSVPLRAAAPEQVIVRAQEIYASITPASTSDADHAPPSVAYDANAQRVTISGEADSVQRFQQALDDAMQLQPAQRTGRLHALANITPDEAADRLRAIIERSPEFSIEGEEAIAIEPMTELESLFIAADPAQHEFAQRLLQSIDQPGAVELPPLRLVQVRSGMANVAAALLRQRYDQRAPEQKRRRPVEIVADPNGEVLLIAAHDDLFAEISSFVATLDERAAVQATSREQFLIGVQHQSAHEIAQLMTSLDAQQRRAPADAATFIPAPGNRAVIVTAPAKRRAALEALAAQLDQTAQSTDVRIIPLQRLDAAQAATLVRSTLAGLNANGDAPSMNRVVVEPVAGAAAVLIAAPPAQHDLVREVVQRLDAEHAIDLPPMRVFHLHDLDAAPLAAALTQHFTDQPQSSPLQAPARFTADPSTNTLLITAPQELMDDAASIIESLSARPSQEMRIVRLSNLRASRAESMLSAILQSDDVLDDAQLPVWMRAQLLREREQRSTDDPTPTLRFTADQRLNAIVLAGHPRSVEDAARLLEQLDQSEPGNASASARQPVVLPVRSGDAAALAAALNEFFSSSNARAALDEDEAPIIRGEPSSNALLVEAEPGQLALIRQMIAELDRASALGPQRMRVISIDPSRAEAGDVAEMLKRWIDREQGVQVEVISIDELWQRQPNDDDEGDAASAPGEPSASTSTDEPTSRTTKTSRQPGVWRALMYSTLGSMQDAAPDESSTPARAAGEAAPHPDLTVAFDPATNSLIIIGPEQAVERVEVLAAQLQAQLPALPARVRYLELPAHTDADALASLITNVLRRSLATLPNAERSVTVIADASGPGLIVAAPDAQFRTVIELVQVLAAPQPNQEVAVKQYVLESITAAQAAEGVRALLEPQPDGGGRRNQQAQRMRASAIQLAGENGEALIAVALDPQRVRVVPDAENNRLLVIAPAEGLALIDRFLAMIDQSPLDAQPALTMLALEHAAAADVQPTLERVLRTTSEARAPGGRSAPAEVIADARTNMLIIYAHPETIAEAERVLTMLDQPAADSAPLAIMTLNHADPQQTAGVLRQLFDDRGAGQTRKLTIAPSPVTRAVLVRGEAETVEQIRAVLAELDQEPAGRFTVRAIPLERADASVVATSLQQLFDSLSRLERGAGATGAEAALHNVVIVGDQTSRTLLVAAADDDFERVRELAQQFDSPEATSSLTARVFELEHARATEIEQTLQDLIEDLTWNQGPLMWNLRGRTNQQERGTLAVRADARRNAIIVTGEGDKFQLVEELIDLLDAPAAEAQQRTIVIYRLEQARVALAEEVLRDLFSSQQRSRWSWWDEPEDTSITIRSDAATRSLIVAAPAQMQDRIAQAVAELDQELAPFAEEVRVIALQHADARDVSSALREWLGQREREGGQRTTVAPASSLAALLVAGPAETLSTIDELVQQLDTPHEGERTTQIVPLTTADADEIARILREQFASRRGVDRVVVSPLRTGRSLIITAPAETLAEITALAVELDARPDAEPKVIRTYALATARATEAAAMLRDALQLDATTPRLGGDALGDGAVIIPEGAVAPVRVEAKIVPDRRSNTLIVTATPDSLPVIESLLEKIDAVKTASPVEYRLIPLRHAVAADVSYTLGSFVRRQPQSEDPRPTVDYDPRENRLIIAATPDQFDQIMPLIESIDQPSETRRITEFVPLEFAEAEQVQDALSVFYGPLALEADTPGRVNTRIVADPATNSLVISAAEGEWENIRALIDKLDSEEYDDSLQLRVLPLRHAEARSVASAINEAFGAAVQRSTAGGSRSAAPPRVSRDEGDRRDLEQREVLVQAEEWVRAAAEPQTNSIVVSANYQNLRKVEQIVEQLDQPESAMLPPARIISVMNGDASALAQALRDMYPRAQSDAGRGALRIAAAPEAGAVIIRAEPEQFAELAALAEALQQEGNSRELAVRIVPIENASAAQVADALLEPFAARAVQMQAALVMRVDDLANTLIVAAPQSLQDEIAAAAQTFAQIAPPAGQRLMIIELEHVAPSEVIEVIESLQREDDRRRGGAQPILRESVKAIPLPGRTALLLSAGPSDRGTIIELLRSIDSEPLGAEHDIRIISLQHAQPEALAQVLQAMLDPEANVASSARQSALQEQVRRLSTQSNGQARNNGEPPLPTAIDLTKPISIVPHPAVSALVIRSTAANVTALVAIVEQLDALPITEPVTVQIFPLKSIAAAEFARIIAEIFTQGKELTDRDGMPRISEPDGMVGRALLEEIALSVDERTNSVIAAGKEEAVALVEVLSQRLDTDLATGWVEPRIIELEYADAQRLALTLQRVLVEGASNLPQATPMQRQIARLRTMQRGGDGAQTSDIFQPMSRLVIEADPQLNALVLVGTEDNLAVVEALIAQLDVEGASPAASVRLYPMEEASAARLVPMIDSLFQQQVRSGALRDEDRVSIQADPRTNTLIVSASERSFDLLDRLLPVLDTSVDPELRPIQRIKLERASASRIAPTMQALLDARLRRLQVMQPETAELERITVLADEVTNSLLVAASEEGQAVVAQLAQELDQAAIDEELSVEVIALESANADRLAQTIEAVLQRRLASLPPEAQRVRMPLVLSDPRSNSLLVAAPPSELAAVRELVATLERTPMSPAVGMHVITLESAQAEEIAPRLQRLMQQRQRTLGPAATPSDQVSIEADRASNSLIVAASAENLQAIRALIDALTEADAEGVGEGDFELIQLTSSRAGDVVRLLRELYIDAENRRRGQQTIRVTADERLNAVLVRAPQRNVEEIRALVQQLDDAQPNQVIEIKYVPLSSANALETVSLIENVLSGRGLTARRDAGQAIVLKYLREIVQVQEGEGDDGGVDDDEFDEESKPEIESIPAQMEIGAAIRDSISLTPDVRTNTIIVRAPRQAMELIEQMIRDLDQSSIGAKNIRIFQLKNADAVAMAELLSDLFNLRQGRDLLVLKPREAASGSLALATPQPLAASPDIVAGPVAPPLSMLEGTELTAVPDERQQLSITVDSRTNSLIVSASPTYLELVSKVVEELDQVEANERDVFVYPLRNAMAAEVARVIGDFVREEQRKLLDTLSTDQLGSAARVLEREVTIVGDDKSNTVLVSASPRYMDRVRSMIEELDVDPPQVLIQVLLAEVTLDYSDEWGVDLGVMTDVGEFDLGAGFGFASAFVTGMGVPNVSVTSDDFDLLIRALSAQGRLQVLSNPSVMAANNEPARIQVGETIRVPVGTSFDQGAQQSFIEPEEIGIILNVVPSINPDGFVRMKIEPEISELSARTIQISEDFESPIITRRNAETTVTVKDGQTVVIGGLISDRYERRSRKVPFFGDIPAIGALFRSENNTAIKTELLIVLTPYVIASPAEIDALRRREVARMSVPPEIKEQIEKSMLEGTLYDADGKPIRYMDDPE